MAARDHHLGDIRAVRLVGRRGEVERDGADRPASGKGAENDPPAVGRGGQTVAPERRGARCVLIETDGEASVFEFGFRADDTLVVGQESAGSPAELRAICAASVRIPMASGVRSLNVAMAAGVAVYEALRQTGQANLLGEPK